MKGINIAHFFSEERQPLRLGERTSRVQAPPFLGPHSAKTILKEPQGVGFWHSLIPNPKRPFLPSNKSETLREQCDSQTLPSIHAMINVVMTHRDVQHHYPIGPCKAAEALITGCISCAANSVTSRLRLPDSEALMQEASSTRP